MQTDVGLTVVVVGRNSPYIVPCIESIVGQFNRRFKIALLDDASSDKTFDRAEELLRAKGRDFFRITNEKRCGKVSMYLKLLQRCQPGEFLVNVDADDCLTDLEAIDHIWNLVKEGAWCVWGFHKDKYGRSWCLGRNSEESLRAFDPLRHVEKIIQTRGRRIWIDHPHCCYAGLLQQVKPEDLMVSGELADAATDRFLFQPVLEMAGPARSVCTGKTLYFYNSPIPTNVSGSKRGAERSSFLLHHLYEKPPYARRECLSWEVPTVTDVR